MPDPDQPICFLSELDRLARGYLDQEARSDSPIDRHIGIQIEIRILFCMAPKTSIEKLIVKSSWNDLRKSRYRRRISDFRLRQPAYLLNLHVDHYLTFYEHADKKEGRFTTLVLRGRIWPRFQLPRSHRPLA